MRKEQIEIGKRYTMKVGNKIIIVRIDSESPHGGWNATNYMTGHKLRIGTAALLRYPIGAEHNVER